MKRSSHPIAAVATLTLLAAASAGDARKPPEQDAAREQMRAGAIRPLREIQAEWRGDMPGYAFIGSDFDPGSGGYRLKFMREGQVVWIDVDGKGRELRRSGR